MPLKLLQDCTLSLSHQNSFSPSNRFTCYFRCWFYYNVLWKGAAESLFYLNESVSLRVLLLHSREGLINSLGGLCCYMFCLNLTGPCGHSKSPMIPQADRQYWPSVPMSVPSGPHYTLCVLCSKSSRTNMYCMYFVKCETPSIWVPKWEAPQKSPNYYVKRHIWFFLRLLDCWFRIRLLDCWLNI